MAVIGATLTFQLPFTFKSQSFAPRIQLKSSTTLHKRPFHFPRPIFSSLVEQDQNLSFTEPESQLLEALVGIQGRGRAASKQQLCDVADAVDALEDLKGVTDPTSSRLIEGRWQLIFTTRPGTASPIQRTFVGVELFKVFQEVYLRTNDQRVSNIVKFSDAIGELKVEAAATIKDGKRILFQFDQAAFSFKFLPFKVPYPVPFRLLGDEAKGWLDTTYLSHSGNIRISRGNKGTTFVLQKKMEPRQRLLEAISIGSGVIKVIDELVSLRKQEDKRYYNGILEGEWRLIWSSQSEAQNWQDIAADGLKGLQIVKKTGQIENLVDPFPGIRYCAAGDLIKTTDTDAYNVSMDNGYALVGGFKFPVEIKSKYTVQILYIDSKIRITRGNKDILFVHSRLLRTRKV